MNVLCPTVFAVVLVAGQSFPKTPFLPAKVGIAFLGESLGPARARQRAALCANLLAAADGF